MPAEPSNQQTPSLQQLLAPWRLTLLAGVLCGIFLIQMLATSLPLGLLKPAWQLSFIGTLLSQSYLPLLALGLLHLTASIADWDRRLMWWLRLSARLAIAVSLGFLLLIPLQWTALGQLNSKADVQRQRELTRLETLVSSLHQVVRQSSSTDEIFSRLQGLSAPPPPATYQSLPLPILRERMKVDLLEAEKQLTLRRADAARSRFWKVVPLASRNTLLLLAYAIGFAGLAQRRRNEVPWLLECLETLQGLPQLLRFSRRRDSRSSGHILASYVEELSRNKQP